MAAKGIARLTKADKTTELRMISCGAGAGMAAAFNAPLAGTMFVLEEIHHTFDKSLLCMGIVSAVTADYISKLFFGQNTVFNYDTVNFPLKYYWLLLIMGVFSAFAVRHIMWLWARLRICIRKLKRLIISKCLLYSCLAVLSA